MSCWTYVTGWIECSPFGETQEEKEYVLKTVLNHLPIVEGSEEPMYVHIMQAGGYNSSTGCDEYDQFSNIRDVKWSNNTQVIETYNRSHRTWQSRYYIFVEGHFRDRYFSETYKQFMKWLTRLAKRVIVSRTTVEISEGWSGKTKLVQLRDMYDLMEGPSWYNNQKNWCEHLLRKEDPNGKDR